MKFWLMIPAVSFALIFAALLVGIFAGPQLRLARFSKYRRVALVVTSILAIALLANAGRAIWSFEHRIAKVHSPASYIFQTQADAACLNKSREAILKSRKITSADVSH